MAILKGWLEAKPVYYLGEEIRLRFFLQNEGKDDLYVLTWYTPLEGLTGDWASDCLIVNYGERLVPYDGRMVKRGNPLVKDYILLRAGNTITADFKLHEAYSISSPGQYRVALNAIIGDSFSSEIDVVVAKVAGLNQDTEEVVLLGDGIAFLIEAHAEPLRTRGELARALEAHDADEGNADEEVPKAPVFNGGDASRQAIVLMAHNDAYLEGTQAIARLTNDNQYEKWFGKFKSGRFNQVRRNYVNITTKMSIAIFTYDLTESECDQSWYAYTYKGTQTVFICSRFWNVYDGHSNRAVILHEHSHATASTNDIAHTVPGCLELAAKDPANAIQNASSYEFYAETL